MKAQVVIKNRKASFLYEFIEKYTAGIQLEGTEIKSIRTGKASLVEAYCFFSGQELYVRGLSISEYENRGYVSHDPKRDRKLLLNRRELNKLKRGTREKGLTIVATRVFINERGLAKLELALARGKKQYDRREDIKRRDTDREMERAKKKG